MKSPTSHIEQLSAEAAQLYRSITPETALEPFLTHAERFKKNNDFKSACIFFERIYQVTGSKHILLELAHCKEVLGELEVAEKLYSYVANKARAYEARGETPRAYSLFSKLHQYTGEAIYLLDCNYLLETIPEQVPSVISNSMFKPVEFESFPTPASSPKHSANACL